MLIRENYKVGLIWDAKSVQQYQAILIKILLDC